MSNNPDDSTKPPAQAPMPRARRRDPYRPPPLPVTSPPPQAPIVAPPPGGDLPPAATPRTPGESGLYFPWWSVVGLVAIVGVLSCSIWGFIFTRGGTTSPGGRTPTIIITTATVTFAAPTLASTAAPPTATLSPQPTPIDTLPPSNITVEAGVTVEIVGTGAAGLSMRDGAGTGYEVRFVAHDGEVFIITDGPQFGGGYEWWHIEATDGSGREGWSVRQYMQAIAPPPAEVEDAAGE